MRLPQVTRLRQDLAQNLGPRWAHQRVQERPVQYHLEWRKAKLALTARRTTVPQTWRERAKGMVSTMERWRSWNLADNSERKGRRGKERVSGKRYGWE